MAIHALAQAQSILAPAFAQPLQQQRIRALVAEGKTKKKIGASLELSAKTAKNYIRFIFQKLNLTRRAHAAPFSSVIPPQEID